MNLRQAQEIEALIPNLRRYARVLVRDPDLADDMVQDCLERAISRFHRFTPDTNLRGWLFTILLNVVRTHGRKAQRRVVVSIDDYIERFSSLGAQEDTLRVRDLRRAFSELPESFKEALVLVAIEGMSYEEAAGVAKVPIGTIRSRLSRAREQLRQVMDAAEAPARHDKVRAMRVRRRAAVPQPALAAAAA